MRKAAAMRVVDFKEARLLDRKWWLRLNWLLEEIETKECKALLELKFSQHAAALDYQAGKSFDHHWKHLNDLQGKWISFTFPWMDTRSASSSDDLAKMWKRYCGDPSDPAVQERITETAESFKNRRPAPSSQNPRAWESL